MKLSPHWNMVFGVPGPWSLTWFQKKPCLLLLYFLPSPDIKLFFSSMFVFLVPGEALKKGFQPPGISTILARTVETHILIPAIVTKNRWVFCPLFIYQTL